MYAVTTYLQHLHVYTKCQIRWSTCLDAIDRDPRAMVTWQYRKLMRITCAIEKKWN